METINNKAVGKVLVVGGGVAGVQASLDLAYGGFKVYLLESKDAIGGVMSQLDKTFPTNDCAMCILSPKLVEVGSNPNIELLTRSKIVKVEGASPHFKVTVLREPRYVDISACKGCGDCANACPVNIVNDYEESLTYRKAIFRRYEQAVPSAFGITKYGMSPCRTACPIHVNAQGYIALISKGEYENALSLIREVNPFPGITGRICTRPCEEACSRAKVEESIAIDLLKRYVSDKEKITGNKWNIEKPSYNGKDIAIIGSGPAGLLAAYDLSRKGYGVTVFERMPEIGGMLRYGIPPYRLPREVLNEDLNILNELGVTFKVNNSIDNTLFNDLKDKFNAVFIAVGACKSRKMNIPGEDLPNVIGATDFLKNALTGEIKEFTGSAAVIGGGNAAIDAARTLLRLGAEKVEIIYRRTRAEMPANNEEIEEAIQEGIIFNYLRTPVEISKKRESLILKIQEMKLGEPDSSGRRRPVPVEDSFEDKEFDMVVMAVSQEPEIEPFKELSVEKGLLKVDPLTLETNIKGVFAGGDAVTGPATYIEALAAGRKGAVSIDRYLRGEDLRTNREKEGPYKEELDVETKGVEKKDRAKPVLLIKEKLKGDFSEVNKGLKEEDVLEEAKRCLNCGGCSECMECVRACEPKAINHDMKASEEILDVGSIILAPGFDEVNVSKYTQYGCGIFKNVVTSIQFERILSASGPYGGVIKRPGDLKHPRKIAFIQCVGSRDKINEHCSSVCCMYATKEAVIAKEHSHDVEPTIFYIDIRSFGKDFDRYIDRAKNEYGIRYIKSRVAGVTEMKDGSLKLRYETDDGILNNEIFDIVVLSVGLNPPDNIKELSNILDVELNKSGFIETLPFNIISSTKNGIVAAGASTGPRDIPESVTGGSAAAQIASSIIASERGKEIVKKVLPPEIDVTGEKPRVGVFVCHCGLNIGSVVDVKSVAEYVKNLPYVIYSETNLYTCSSDTQEKIKEKVKEYNLNRVVVASCTPRTHEPLFQDTIREAGLNRFLFEMANIRDQDSWVHQNDKEGATEKAKDLVKAAVARVVDRTPLAIQLLPITKRGLVIGGGIAGMNAALSIAEEGFETYLIEKDSELGGNAKFIHYMLDGSSVDSYLSELKNKVLNNSLINVRLNANIDSIEGYVGNYKTTLSTGVAIEHGVVIVSTGAIESEIKSFMYGKSERIITQREFEEKLYKNELIEPMNVVMVQCVESRNKEHPYCSRICCQEAIKNAIKIKENSPQSEVYILYRDIRTYGLNELYYKKARELGIIFINYDEDCLPEVTLDGENVFVSVRDALLRRDLILNPDLLVLSAGITAEPGNENLSKFLKVPLNEDKFFLEAHVKLRPVEFATDGVFLAGLAHSPLTIEESIVQARAAAGKASIILSKEGIEAGGKVAEVNERNCVGCGVCESVCAYGAVKLEEKKIFGELKKVSSVNPSLCKGCGACAGGCRSNAIDISGFSNEEIVDAIDAILEPI